MPCIEVKEGGGSGQPSQPSHPTQPSGGQGGQALQLITEVAAGVLIAAGVGVLINHLR